MLNLVILRREISMLGQTLEDACREVGFASPQRIGDILTSDDLMRLFAEAPGGVHFWITDAFHQVAERIPPQQCYRFWKQEVRHRLLEDGIFLRDMWPGHYAYLAQQWASPFPEPLVELMRCD